MKTTSVLKSSLLAAGIVLALSSAPVLAQTPEALSTAVVSAHQADLEAMLADLAKVQSPDVAKAYEGYLTGQLPKYTGNHRKLHQVALPGHVGAKRMGRANREQEKAAEAAEKLNETHFPRLAMEMARVEQLNPGLKRHFDVLRTLE